MAHLSMHLNEIAMKLTVLCVCRAPWKTSAVAEGATPLKIMFHTYIHEALPSVMSRTTAILFISFTSPSELYQQLKLMLEYIVLKQFGCDWLKPVNITSVDMTIQT